MAKKPNLGEIPKIRIPDYPNGIIKGGNNSLPIFQTPPPPPPKPKKTK